METGKKFSEGQALKDSQWIYAPPTNDQHKEFLFKENFPQKKTMPDFLRCYIISPWKKNFKSLRKKISIGVRKFQWQKFVFISKSIK